MSRPTAVIQLSDSGLCEFVPSAIENHVRNNHTKDSNGEEFQHLTQPFLESTKSQINHGTVQFNVINLFKSPKLSFDKGVDLLNELIDDPENNGKAVVFTKDEQGYISPGLKRSYVEGEQYELISGNFGKGGYGTAQWIKDNTTQLHLIRKEIKKENFKTKEMMALLTIYASPSFPTPYGFMTSKDSVSIFMEYGGFSFNKAVENTQYMHLLSSEACIMDIARQGFEALLVLRTSSLIHMDIKPANLCLRWKEHGRVWLMICDFGSCCMVPVDKPVISGWTHSYMAPEMCRFVLSTLPGYRSMWKKEDKEFSTQIDVYAFCLSLFYLVNRKHWQEILVPDRIELPLYLPSFVATNPTKIQSLINPEWDKGLVKVLSGALCWTPSERITPQEALDILNEPIVPVDIAAPCTNIAESVCTSGPTVSSSKKSSVCSGGPTGSSSRKRRSGEGESGSNCPKLDALHISAEPPEKRMLDGFAPTDRSGDSDNHPGNVPNLAIFDD